MCASIFVLISHVILLQVELGYRLPPPSNCPDVLYNIMQMCWKYDEEDRPTFQEIHGLLQDAQTKIHN